jgi:argonaute-like protein implicated in RNA metabolism and viral defense
MRPEQLSSARNPLLPAALTAIRRASQRARKEARRMGTAIVILRDGRLVRLEGAGVREPAAEYEADRNKASGMNDE